jgi:membrane protease YdiL (CAAX protease family)
VTGPSADGGGRRSLALFAALLVVLVTAAYVPILRERSLGALGGLAVPLLMWAPGLAAIVTSLVCHRSLAPCGVGVERRSWPWLLASLALPVAYTALVYLPLETAGVVRLGGPHLTFDFLVLGLGQSMLFATGEEIGWRGFLSPIMTARLGLVRGNAAVGVVWALYHFPAILFAGYGAGHQAAFGMVAFSLTVTLLSVFLGAARHLSGSMWPAAVFHATHNLIFLHVFDPIERLTPAAGWLVGELGALLCVVMAALAFVGWRLARRAGAG